MQELSIILTTLPSIQAADDISEALIENNYAACINIIGPLKSVYKWEGKIEKNHEFILKIKCSCEKEELLINELKRLHPYSTPEIISLDVRSVNLDYLNWVTESCK